MTSPKRHRLTGAEKESRIIGVHACDNTAQVVTVLRPNTKSNGERIHHHRREPCAECPWREDSPVGRFPAEAYRHSAATCYDMAQTTFACHMHGADKPATCAGFLLCGSAYHNFVVRLALMNGALDLDKITSSVPVYSSYREMAIANGVAADDSALARCRDE